MFVLRTFSEIQYIPVNVEMIKTMSPVNFDTIRIMVIRIIKVVIERTV